MAYLVERLCVILPDNYVRYYGRFVSYSMSNYSFPTLCLMFNVTFSFNDGPTLLFYLNSAKTNIQRKK